MNVVELAEWEAFYQLEPFGPMVDNLNFGSILTFLLNATRKKGDRSHKVKDVSLGDFSGASQEGSSSGQSIEQQKGLVQAIAAAFGGEITTKEERDRKKAVQRRKARRNL